MATPIYGQVGQLCGKLLGFTTRRALSTLAKREPTEAWGRVFTRTPVNNKNGSLAEVPESNIEYGSSEIT